MASDDPTMSEQANMGWLRVAAVKTSPEHPWRVRLLEVTTGAPPPSWEPRSWVYPQAMFDSYTCPTDQLLGLLCAGTILVCKVPVDVKPFELSTPERRRSGAHTSFEPLEWPSEEHQLAIWPPGHNSQYVPDNLLSDREGDPSFLTLYDAATSFFRRPRQTAGGGQVTEEAVFRAQDRTGRIDKVRMLTAEEVLEVTVAGEALDGLTLELAGPEPGPFAGLAGLDRPDRRNPHVTRFELAGGLPPNAWIVLRRGSRWIDRWFLTFPYAREGEEGVEYVPDQATRLEALVADWEHTRVEFKRQIPKNDADARLKLMKTVCAFANGTGGSLLVGVDDEDRSYHGIPAQAIDGLKAQLDQMVRSSVHPDPPTRFDTLPIPDSELVVLELVVEAGDTLYVCGHPKESGRPYVRHHASTEVATQPEMTQILQSRNAQEPFPVPAW